MKKISLYLRGAARQCRFSSPTARARRRAGEHAPLLGPHAAERVGNVERRDLLVVLELEELVAAVPGHVDEDVAA